MFHLRALCITLTLTCLIFLTAHGADWSRYLGPDYNNTSSETGLADTWPEGGPPELWSVSVGEGFGGAAIRDGRVFILDRNGDQGDVLRCLDVQSGEALWQFAYASPGKLSHDGSRNVPTVTDTYVLFVGPFGDFYCLSRETQEPVWDKHLLKDFGVGIPKWGVSHAPLLLGNRVIVAPVADDAGMVAYALDTGKEIWRSEPFKGRMQYVSPVPLTLDGMEQVVFCTNKETVGVDPDSGKILWRYDGWQCGIAIAAPMEIPENRVFVTGGYGAGSAMFRVQKAGEGWKAEEQFHTQEAGSQIQQALLHEDYLYINSNDNKRRDGELCLSLDGKVQWKTRNNPNFERGNQILADGKIFVLDGRKAELVMFDPNPEAYRELARCKPLESGKAWSPMALSNGLLVLRDQHTLKCLDLRKP